MSPPRRNSSRSSKKTTTDFGKQFNKPLRAQSTVSIQYTETKPKDAWATLVPSGETCNSLIPIYLTDNTHYLGAQPEDGVFKSLLADPRIDVLHCAIFKEYKENIGTIVKLQNLSQDGAVRVLDNDLMSKQYVELKDGDYIRFPSSKGHWYIYRIEIDLKSKIMFHSIYDIKGTLGKGHFAEVMLVTPKNSIAGNESKLQQYAVKIIDKSNMTKNFNEQKLHDEIIVMYKISHPSLVRIYNLYNENDKIYLIMEYVKDGEFFDFISQKKKLSEYETRIVFKQLFDAIKYLHGHRIAHRDLKPENILMSSAAKLEVKISDFGLSKLLGPEHSLMKTLCGTRLYVAPEVIARTPNRSYGRAVDMWSLGVILYVCLCGNLPFADELGPPGLLDQIRIGKYKFHSPAWDNISDNAKDLIKGLLTVNTLPLPRSISSSSILTRGNEYIPKTKSSTRKSFSYTDSNFADDEASFVTAGTVELSSSSFQSSDSDIQYLYETSYFSVD
ncbi:13207_t:CDS:2 [Gigaspora margarita]|uniref:13207_t:CDS:1 n=1 Tax=Gigaspora margarita TaxID=4874 RepID=A0ABN7VIH2_GIGMA|nr:13207_t:CDS:2 [Gigaspora margarita]